MVPLISVCIPAYKNVRYLQRLLQSIEQQSFKDFEIVVTDDSDDCSVHNHLAESNYSFAINYMKNEPALGMVANWNFCISCAKGEWIKLMHDDDWFSYADSLQEFANYTSGNHKFIFSAYTDTYVSNNEQHPVYMSKRWKKILLQHPSALFATNVIGPPSVTLVHKSISIKYDEQLKWRVDIDYYMQLLQNEAYAYIEKSLVNIGLSEEQVTALCINNPEVEIPETLYMIKKNGVAMFRNIYTYEGLWRLLYELKIDSIEAFNQYNDKQFVPKLIRLMLKHLSKTKKSWLSCGFYFKTTMYLSYFKNKLFGSFK